MAITLYDIPSTAPQNAFSPNTWKARHSLNYKGLPYKTEWLDLIDIEPRCKELGIPPTGLKANGSPHYTLPAIYDPKKDVYIADSFKIVEYLEKTYPEKPSLFPHNSTGILVQFDNNVRSVAPMSVWMSITPAIFLCIKPTSKDYFRRSRENMFGKAIENMTPEGDAVVAVWNELKEGLETIDSWYKHGGGPFIMGDTVSWADICVGSLLIFLRTIFGEESEQWKDIATEWHDGRWGALMSGLKKYQAVV